MKYNNLEIKDAKEILLDPFVDERGFFSRIFCKEEMKKNNIEDNIFHINNSYNKKKGTIRGLHYQINGKEESKILRCIRGSFFDIIVDLRKNSPTFCKYISLTLDSNKRNMIYVPKGCANGIQILEDNTELIYFSSQEYSPDNEKGIRWNDPFFNFKWPIKETNISIKDQKLKNFDLKKL